MIDSNVSMETIWSRVVSNIEELVTPQQYRMWFKTMRLESYADHTYRFAVHSRFLRDWISKYYLDTLKKAVGRALGVDADVEVVIDTEFTETTKTEERASEPAPKPVTRSAPPLKVERKRFDGLNPRYNFDNFIVGTCNQLSYAASLAVSESLSKAYNPLFLHGSSGLGKTHLIQAICNTVSRRDPSSRMLLTSCETFVNHFISALEKRDLDRFRTRYRHIDILLIDDIHLLANKERTQEEFFHTFNTLFNSGKQIVLTSDSYPSDIPTLEERLVSRFKWGMVTQMFAPDFETRCAILKMKARQKQVEISDEVVSYLAENIDTNIRELEGAVTKVLGYATLMNCELNLETACLAMKDVIKKRDTVITMDHIVKLTTECFNVKLSDLQSKKRTKSIAEPRQVAMFIAKRLTNHSLQEIGAYFGGRDHSTVLHAYNKVSTRTKADEVFKSTVDGLIQRIAK